MSILRSFINKHKREKLVKKINKSTNSNFSNKTYLFNAKVEGHNRSQGLVYLYKSEVGLGTYFSGNNRFVNCKIGRYCSIGNNSEIVECTHPTNLVSTYPGFYSNNSNNGISFVDTNQMKRHLITENGYFVEIGNDVWIGRNVLIRGGVKIGDGAVIGMGSIVTKDVPPYAVVGGVPARVIKYRFDKEEIKKLLEIKWWNWPIEDIKSKSEKFKDVKDLLG